MVRGILFDFRDTILNVRQANYAQRHKLFSLLKNLKPELIKKEFEIDLDLARQKVIATNNKNPRLHNWTKLNVEQLIRQYRLKVNKLIIKKWLLEMDRAFIAKTVPYAEAIKTIKWLRNKKLFLGVIIDGTSFRERAIIKKLKLAPYFKTIIISEELGWNKFTTKPLAQAIKNLNLPPQTIISLGDRLDKDIYQANKLGLTSVQIKRPHSRYAHLKSRSALEKPQYIIKNLSAVKKLIKIIP